MSRSLVMVAALAAAIGCRNREIAERPPAPIDAAIAIDAKPIAIDGPVAVAGPRPTRLAAGSDSTCAVMSDQTVRCWGHNDHGQLGDGTTNDAAKPVALPLHGVKDVQIAGATACALLDDASIACWGQIAWLGKSADTLKPTGVLGVKGVKQMFVLGHRACAKIADDSLVCWGGVNPGGHFTTASIDQRHYPTPFAELSRVVALHDTAALTSDGTVWLWNLADGRPAATPLASVVEINERDGTVCGRDDAGAITCAGERLACAGPPPAPKPPPVKKPPPKKPPAKVGKKPAKPTKPTKPTKPVIKKPEPEPVVAKGFPLALPRADQLAFGVGWCVVTKAGKLQCGDGCGRLDPPRRGLDKIVEVMGSCARTSEGAVRCWASDAAEPKPISGVADAHAIAIGRAHGCALVTDGVACWGDNQYGQLGRGTVDKGTPNAEAIAFP